MTSYISYDTLAFNKELPLIESERKFLELIREMECIPEYYIPDKDNISYALAEKNTDGFIKLIRLNRIGEPTSDLRNCEIALTQYVPGLYLVDTNNKIVAVNFESGSAVSGKWSTIPNRDSTTQIVKFESNGKIFIKRINKHTITFTGFMNYRLKRFHCNDSPTSAASCVMSMVEANFWGLGYPGNKFMKSNVGLIFKDWENPFKNDTITPELTDAMGEWFLSKDEKDTVKDVNSIVPIKIDLPPNGGSFKKVIDRLMGKSDEQEELAKIIENNISASIKESVTVAKVNNRPKISIKTLQSTGFPEREKSTRRTLLIPDKMNFELKSAIVDIYIQHDNLYVFLNKRAYKKKLKKQLGLSWLSDSRLILDYVKGD